MNDTDLEFERADEMLDAAIHFFMSKIESKYGLADSLILAATEIKKEYFP